MNIKLTARQLFELDRLARWTKDGCIIATINRQETWWSPCETIFGMFKLTQEKWKQP